MADGSAGSVLRAVLELGPAPRSAIARHAAISPATLTWQARALIAAGLLVELPETTASAGLGRPYSPLALNAAGNTVVGVHIAAGHSTVAVVDIAGTVLRSRRFPHPGPEPEGILALAAAQVIGVKQRSLPNYHLATAPGSGITDVAGLRGKKIGFSPGQAQGVVVLRTLQAAGIALDEVQLVELNSPQFLTALQGRQIDVAPLGEPSLTKYLDQYRAQGATAVATDAVDALSILWAPTAVLQDSAKLAAAKKFVEFWARGEVWAWEHSEEWIKAYYVEDQEVSDADGRRILESTQKPYFPSNWDAAIEWEQETIDLVTGSGYFGESFDAEELFDRRFEGIAAAAVAAQYRTEESQ